MRNSYPGLKAELIPTASRFSDPSGKRASGWCSRSRCAVVSFAALLLFAAFLYYQLKVLQNGSNVIGAAEQIVKISLKGNGQQTLGAAPSIHWLGPFLSSTPELDVPSRPSAQVLEQVLAQQRQCPNNCSNVGNCLGDLGICQCPGAWRGADCSQQQQRPCTNEFAPYGSAKPQSYVDAQGRDLNITADGWLFGRCSGVCDVEYGHCYCPPIGKYGRVNPAPGAPPGTPAVKEGRPLAHPCKAPNSTADGTRIPWGTPGLTWDALYGPKGWCMADVVDNTHCTCQIDGWDGPGCSVRTESVCLNQCSRRGVCHQRGFCQCQPGWYGIDCAHPSSQEAAMQAPSAGTHPWLRDTSVDAWQCHSSGTGCLEDAVLSIFQANPHVGQQTTGAGTSRGSMQPPSTLRPPNEDTAAGNTSGHDSSATNTSSSNSSSSSSSATSPSVGATNAPVRPSGKRRALHEDALTGMSQRRPAAAAAASSSQQALTATSKRRRPLIYIYNGPEEVTSHVLQYREGKSTCTWRQWLHMEGRNFTDLVGEVTYAVEGFLPELLMGSHHRTLNPEEADYFLVPVLSACYMTHVSATHDFPWYYRPTHRRIKGASVMYWHALNWVRTHYPYWNASRGADHIWIFPHDEGACWAPREVYENSIILTHWGRNTSDNLPSHTQYQADNYTHLDDAQDDVLPVPYTELIGRHRCYTPGKDLVLPVIKMPSHYKDSPYLTGKQPPRDLLALHKGRMGTEPAFGASFSLGVRQTVAQVAERDDWARQHNVHVGSRGSATGVYSQLLARSVFCLVLQGEGWTARFDDAILHGCIPVIVIQDTVGPWGSELDWESFSIRISPQNISSIPSILAAVPPSQVAAMQAKLEQIWHRFAWLSHPLIAQEVSKIQKQALGPGRHRAKGRRVLGDTTTRDVMQGAPKLTIPRVQQDAFHSLMHVLASWLPHRGAAAARQAVQQQSGKQHTMQQQQQQQQQSQPQQQQQQQSQPVSLASDGQPSGMSPTVEQGRGSGQAPRQQQTGPQQQQAQGSSLREQPQPQQQQRRRRRRQRRKQEQQQQQRQVEKPPVT